MKKEGYQIYNNIVDAVRLIIQYTGAEIIMNPIEGLEHIWSIVTLDNFIEQAQEHKVPWTDVTKVFKEPERMEIAEQLVEIINGHPWYGLNMLCSYGIHMARVKRGIVFLDEYQESVSKIRELMVDVKEEYKEYDNLRAEGKLKGETHISPYKTEGRRI